MAWRVRTGPAGDETIGAIWAGRVPARKEQRVRTEEEREREPMGTPLRGEEGVMSN